MRLPRPCRLASAAALLAACCWLPAALAGSSATSAAAAAPGWGVPRLMQLLARHPTGRATFTETKTIALLDEPVVSSGELLYSPPDRLEKHTLQPEAESMIINGKNLTLVQGGQRRELRLPQYPEVEALVAALRGALAGSQALLQSHYALALAGSECGWQLALTPLDEQMRRRWLRKVTIRGARGVVQSVEMEQADGDRSLMEIRPAPAAAAEAASAAAPAPSAAK